MVSRGEYLTIKSKKKLCKIRDFQNKYTIGCKKFNKNTKQVIKNTFTEYVIWHIVYKQTGSNYALFWAK